MRISSIHTYPIKGCYRIDHDRVGVEPWGLAGDRRWMIVDEDGRAITQREVALLPQIRPRLVEGGLLLGTAGRPLGTADELLGTAGKPLGTAGGLLGTAGKPLGAAGGLLGTADGLLGTAGEADLVVPEPTTGDHIDVRLFDFTITATPAGAAADDWLSGVLQCKARLVWLDDPTRRPVSPAHSQPGDRVTFADGFPVLLANVASLGALNDLIAESGSLEGPLPMTRFRPNVVVSGAPPWAEDDWTGGRIRVGDVTFRVPKPCARCVVTTTDQETGERGREPLRTLARLRNVDQRLLFATNLIPDAPGTIAVGDPVQAL
jgi:uncharacterized protein YcbX